MKKVKLIVEIEIDNIVGDSTVFMGKYDEEGEFQDINIDRLKNCKKGEMISIESIYLKYDREDDSFYEFKFVESIIEEE